MSKLGFALASFVLASSFVAGVAHAAPAAPAAPPAQPASPDKTAAPAPPAEPPHPTAGKLQLQVLGGLTTGGIGLGGGFRVGYTVPQKLHLGGVVKVNYDSDGVVSTGWLRPGGEIGWDVSAGPVVVRPYGGAGPAFMRLDAIVGDKRLGVSATTLAIWGGVQLLGSIPSTPVYVGVDVSTVTFLADTSAHPIDGNVVVAVKF
jgi:hypothetical protein